MSSGTPSTSMILDVLFFVTAYLHVFLAPFTKVEESFNLHATHDVVMYGVMPSQLVHYDHFEFPGVVPRSFIGSLLLGWTLYPIAVLFRAAGIVNSKLDLQILARLILATANCIALCVLRRSVSRRFGRTTGTLFTTFTCTQFHIPFWMGRTLPNMFAFPAVNIASAFLIDRTPETGSASKKYHYALGLIVMSAVIFRAELVLLLPALVLHGLLVRQVSLLDIIKTGAVAGFLSLAVTVCVDSYFWQTYPLWPEFAGIYFNVYEGKSSDWGVSPMHAYFSQHLPKLLLASLPLSLLGLVDDTVLHLVQPWLTYVGLISLLGHKEWRFVVYVVPIFNVAAGRAGQMLLNIRSNLPVRLLVRVALVGVVCSNLVFTTFLTTVSRTNYPGGHALVSVHDVVRPSVAGYIYIDNLAAQTGASLFTQLYGEPFGLLPVHHPVWRYNKSEVSDFSPFSHIITESPGGFEKWGEVVEVPGLSRVSLPKPRSIRKWNDVLPTIVLETKLWVMEKQRTVDNA